MSTHRSAEYATFIPTESTFSIPPSATLLKASTSTLDRDEFTPEEWIELNAATTLAGESARTCYSPQLKTPLSYLDGSDNYRKVSDEVVRGTLEAGHLTTRQHMHYTYALSMTRALAYRMHSYPFYNSEEMSQRYVTLNSEGISLPILANAELNAVFQEQGLNLVSSYHQLRNMLIPLTRHFILERFPGYAGKERLAKEVDKRAGKKAQEIARYLLSVGTRTNMYHTVSHLTLLRLHKLALTFDINPEAHELISSMVAAAKAHDPYIDAEIEGIDVLDPSPHIPALLDPDSALELFAQVDQDLEGQAAVVDIDPNLTEHLVRAIRLTIPTLSSDLTDHEVLGILLDPQQNKLLADTTGTMVMDQLSQTMNHTQLSALTSLSLTADAQLQRHRGMHHTRSVIPLLPRLEQDIVIPQLIQIADRMGHHNILEFYLETQAENITVMKTLLEADVPPDQVAYLQTNATRVRKAFSGPLGAFYHWTRQRTCLNAQEEIYGIALAVAQQLHHSNPNLSPFFSKMNPCGIRHTAEIKPYCPEGKLFCGVASSWIDTVDEYPTERPI